MNIPKANPPSRPQELQNPLDRLIYHPLAAKLARALSTTWVTPNMVSVTGALVVVLAAMVYVQPGWPVTAIVGLLLHMGWHVLDGADGDLARLTNRSSPVGEIVDGVCDYASHIVLYIMLGMYAAEQHGWWAWPLMVIAGLSHIVQANFHEVHRRQYLFWVYGTPWLGPVKATGGPAALASLGRAYLALANWLDAGGLAIDKAVQDPALRPILCDKAKQIGPKSLSGSTLLGLNYRTIALGFAMLIGSPIWYFFYVAIVLNALLVSGMIRSRANIAKIHSELSAHA